MTKTKPSVLLCEFVRTLEQNLERLGQFGGTLEEVEYPEVLVERFPFPEEIAAAMAILLDFLDPVDAVNPLQFPGVTHYDNPQVFLHYYAKTNEVLLCLQDRTIQRWIATYYAPLLLSQMNRTWNWWSYSCLKPIATEAETSLSRVRLGFGRVFPFVHRAPLVIPPVDQPQRGIRLLFQWELPQTHSSPMERRVRLEEDHRGHRWVFIFSWEPSLSCDRPFFLYQHGKFWNVFVVAKSHAHAVAAGLLDRGHFNHIHDTAQVVVNSSSVEEATLPIRLHAEMPPLPTTPPVFAYGTPSVAPAEHPLAQTRQRTHSAMDFWDEGAHEPPTAASVAQRAMQSGERWGRMRANSLCELPRAAELVRAESLEAGKARRRRLSGFSTLRLGKRG